MDASKRSLADLPLEILELICTKLCLHCRGHDIGMWKPSVDWREGMVRSEPGAREALQSLTLVSRRLRDVAQPIFFHSFVFRPQAPGPSLRNRLTKLLRILRKRQDLRSHVRAIDIDARIERCTCCYPEEPEDANHDERPLIRMIARDTGIPILMDSFQGDQMDETIVQALIAYVPTLSEICINVPRTWKFEILDLWRFKNSDINGTPRRFLTSARQLELELERDDNDCCWRPHEDCNHPTPNSPVEQLLIDSAPYLHTLCCTASGLDHLPPLNRLKRLQIEFKGSWDGKLPQLLRGMPCLTHLTYWGGNDHAPTPWELQDALTPLQSTLEYLNVRISRYLGGSPGGYCEGWEPPTDRRYVMDSLEGFTSLTSLTIDSCMVWRGTGVGPERCISNSDIRKLGHFLPESLEVLFIDDLEGSVGLFEPLAEAVAGGRFPNLRRVLWYGEGYDREYTMDLDRRWSDQWSTDHNWRMEVADKASPDVQTGHYLAFPDWDRLYTRGFEHAQ